MIMSHPGVQEKITPQLDQTRVKVLLLFSARAQQSKSLAIIWVVVTPSKGATHGGPSCPIAHRSFVWARFSRPVEMTGS